jgi:hypothetical protein
MKIKTGFLLLAFIGVVMVIVAAGIQIVSMDIGRYGLKEYIVVDLEQWAWWSTLGIPLLLGVVYLVAAVFGIRSKLTNRGGALSLFAACFIAGCALSIVSGFGYFALVGTAICLASTAYSRN